MNPRQKTRRLYLPQLASAQPTSAGQALELALPEGEVHHALHVLRLEQGDEVEVFDGQGRRCGGTVARTGRNELIVSVSLPAELSHRPSPRVNLAFALPKGERLDWLLEKTTELAVASLQPVVCERSLVGREEASPTKRQRWFAHCVSAAKQSGLDFLPELREVRGLDDFLAQPPRGLMLVGDLSPAARRLREVAASGCDEVTLLVGPEGGLTGDEVDHAGRAGFVPVRLGQTTLRVETAAIALVAGVMTIVG